MFNIYNLDNKIIAKNMDLQKAAEAMLLEANYTPYHFEENDGDIELHASYRSSGCLDLLLISNSKEKIYKSIIDNSLNYDCYVFEVK